MCVKNDSRRCSDAAPDASPLPPTRSARLSSVLEGGSGSAASLAVLYMDLCARLSLELRPVALDGGRYFVLLPADPAVGLSAGGEQFVIDPYSRGLLLSAAEASCIHCVAAGPWLSLPPAAAAPPRAHSAALRTQLSLRP